MIVRVAVAAGRGKVRQRVASILSGDGVLVTTGPSLDSLLETGKALAADMIVVDLNGTVDPGFADTIDAFPNRPDLIVLTDALSPSREAGLIAAGATAVLSSTLADEELASAIRSLVKRRGGRQVAAPNGTPADRDSSGVASASMVELLALADRVATSDSSVLLLGETGSGKEWLARRLHARSPRTAGPFVAVNCAAIPEGLAESELFGHVRGAFTGAVRARRGHFEMAHEGTLFLDEVAELSLSVQVRLLRVLQERSFQPVGGERPIHVDLRIVAATNRSLEEAVERGDFRRDLYYRLAVITLNVPPLRERPEDIRALIELYSRQFAEQLGRPVPRFSPRALSALISYGWPGNIRELINVIERAVLLGGDHTLVLEDLPPALWTDPAAEVNGRTLPEADRQRADAIVPYGSARDEALAAFERRYLVDLLECVDGRIGLAAESSGMSPRTLYNKMQRYGLRKEDFRRRS